MAYPCRRVSGKDCDGCGDCCPPLGQEWVGVPSAPLRCEECRQPIDEDYYYNIESTILCGFCVDKLYRREVPVSD